MARERRQARILAMQAICQWEVQGDSSREVLEDLLGAGEACETAGPYAIELVEGYLAQREHIDERIAKTATKWDLSRISPVERNIMRVAATELLADKVPPKVVLNEAIEIGREYGGADSPRFINGILDELLRALHDRKEEDA